MAWTLTVSADPVRMAELLRLMFANCSAVSVDWITTASMLGSTGIAGGEDGHQIQTSAAVIAKLDIEADITTNKSNLRPAECLASRKALFWKLEISVASKAMSVAILANSLV